MARWEADAPGRLASAAMELFLEQGYEATTVAQIAARAGLTERTFFRQYADKREVLFAGSEGFLATIVDGVRAAPPQAGPFEAALAGYAAAADLFGPASRTFARQRHTLILASQELQERELVKLAATATAVAAVLRERGVPAARAVLAAEAARTAFSAAFAAWTAGGEHRDLCAVLADTVADLRAVTA